MVALFVLVTIIALLAIEMVVGKLEGRRFNVAAPARAGLILSEAPPEGTFFHRGHAWARVGDDGLVTAGVDSFARAMTGEPDEVSLPEIGANLSQGAQGWLLRRGDHEIPMLSPVDGEVVAVNEETVRFPAAVAADPYNNGWLVKVRPSKLRANLANLLEGNLARRWMQESYERLNQFFSPELGVVMQDGGSLADGIIDSIEPERLPEALREFFLVEPDTVNQ